MRRCDVDRLDPTRSWWVPAVVSPRRNWPGAPGCRRGARFLVDCATLSASRERFDPFDSRLTCLQWIMRHRAELERQLPGAPVRPVRLDRWLLGLE
ncbi:MAG: hypothetical protein ACK4K7_00465 [Allosphingosinicella sp.]|uniref:hypothetical protein n=1 Tax=Allosphingosinicella sp. TaxID=2823234 RepID=UPI00394B2865